MFNPYFVVQEETSVTKIRQAAIKIFFITKYCWLNNQETFGRLNGLTNLCGWDFNWQVFLISRARNQTSRPLLLFFWQLILFSSYGKIKEGKEPTRDNFHRKSLEMMIRRYKELWYSEWVFSGGYYCYITVSIDPGPKLKSSINILSPVWSATLFWTARNLLDQGREESSDGKHLNLCERNMRANHSPEYMPVV